jgi:hypothetical protein
MQKALLLLPLALAACTLPGRQIFAPLPVAAEPANIAATRAFAGHVPLVEITPGTPGFAAPLKSAVAQALAIKPDAVFAVVASAPAAATPDASAARLQALAGFAARVAQSLLADGIPPARLSLAAVAAAPAAPNLILVYVK